MTINHKTLEMARDVIQMLGAPSPLHFSKEEIIKWQECNAAIDEALAQPEKEPDVYIPADALRQLKGTSLLILRSVPLYGYRGDGLTPLYTTPPQRKPLTDEQIRKLWAQHAACIS